MGEARCEIGWLNKGQVKVKKSSQASPNSLSWDILGDIVEQIREIINSLNSWTLEAESYSDYHSKEDTHPTPLNPLESVMYRKFCCTTKSEMV